MLCVNPLYRFKPHPLQHFDPYYSQCVRSVFFGIKKDPWKSRASKIASFCLKICKNGSKVRRLFDPLLWSEWRGIPLLGEMSQPASCSFFCDKRVAVHGLVIEPWFKCVATATQTNKRQVQTCLLFVSGRSDGIWTHDLLVPNQARYQLRYTPTCRRTASLFATA